MDENVELESYMLDVKAKINLAYLPVSEICPHLKVMTVYGLCNSLVPQILVKQSFPLLSQLLLQVFSHFSLGKYNRC